MNTLKNKPLRTGLFLAMAVLVLAFAAAALAQAPQAPKGSRGHGFGPEGRLDFLAEKLDLSAEQVAGIEAIQQAGRDKGLELRKDMMRLRNELEGEMLKDSPSEKTALDLVKQIGQVRIEMESNRLSGRLDMRELLTPEQRDKMLVMGQDFEGRRGGGRGRGAGRHGAPECDGSGPGQGQGCPRGK